MRMTVTIKLKRGQVLMLKAMVKVLSTVQLAPPVKADSEPLALTAIKVKGEFDSGTLAGIDKFGNLSPGQPFRNSEVISSLPDRNPATSMPL